MGNYELRDTFCVYICGFLYALGFFSPNSQKDLYFIEGKQTLEGLFCTASPYYS